MIVNHKLETTIDEVLDLTLLAVEDIAPTAGRSLGATSNGAGAVTLSV